LGRQKATTSFEEEAPMRSELQISRLDADGGLKLVGELDVATAQQLREALREAVFAAKPVLDLSELTFLDSCGVHAILEVARAHNGNGPVVLLDPSDAVTRVLEIIGIDQHSGLELRRSTTLPVASSDRHALVST
jgi:anti-anti-sigma factor